MVYVFDRSTRFQVAVRLYGRRPTVVWVEHPGPAYWWRIVIERGEVDRRIDEIRVGGEADRELDPLVAATMVAVNQDWLLHVARLAELLGAARLGELEVDGVTFTVPVLEQAAAALR